MKRLVFCFDGTWNRLNADTPTNVVLTAASIQRIAPDGVPQLIHYDEGVGTGRLEKMSGGMFGVGLLANVREAYRFLIFNYDPGDEIFVFGFSRGAFSARTFIGLVRHVGPLRRLHAARIDEAVELYTKRSKAKDAVGDGVRKFRAEFSSGVCIGAEDDDWRCRNVPGYAAGSAPALRIRFLGVWDTVSAMGVPEVVPLSSLINRRHRFHDASLDGFVEAARHAVAIDERRATFPAHTWGDLAPMNADRGFAPDDPDAPYQERWFPGTHGSVGGGGDIRGLSDGALAWVLRGAKSAGLRLDFTAGSRIQAFSPDPLAPLVNVAKGAGFSVTRMLMKDRPGPEHLWQLAPSTIRRWLAAPDRLPERVPYRPGTLGKVAAALEALPPPDVPEVEHTVHLVVAGDTLSKLAERFYGDAERWHLLFGANRDFLDEPDQLFVGQRLRVPALSDA
jgi:uncharacterized protein (DUF2235 family)